MPAVADAPGLVTTLCRLGPAPQPSLNHRPTTPDAKEDAVVYISEWRNRIKT